MRLSHSKQDSKGRIVTLEISGSKSEIYKGEYKIEGVWFDGKDVSAYFDMFPDVLDSLFASVDWADYAADYEYELRNQMHEA